MRHKTKPKQPPPATSEPLSQNEKLRILYDDRKTHREFSKLTTPEKLRVLDAMDVSTSHGWIQTEIADLLEQRKNG